MATAWTTSSATAAAPMSAASRISDHPLAPSAFTRFGEDIAVADLDGDGIDEVITGTDLNEAFIFWAAEPSDWTLVPKPPTSYVNPFGDQDYSSTLSAADINQDGYGDVLVSDLFDGNLPCSLANSGTIFVALGPYYATFLQLFDAAPQCMNGFGRGACIGQLDADDDLKMVVGVITSDDAGLFNASHITIFGK